MKRHIRAGSACLTASLLISASAFSAPAQAAPTILGFCKQTYTYGIVWDVVTNKSSYTYFRIVRSGGRYEGWQRGDKLYDFRYRGDYYFPNAGTVEMQAKVEDHTGWAIRSMGYTTIPGAGGVCG